mmetsp:Transcript_28598/g.35419  ORF Transcript_28598/g.35419 Transcript_28598/m.35419 type:complete len:82 (+) Transcript_28598:508-753(+)
MMRITPLAVWARHLKPASLERCVEEEVAFTHSNHAIWEVCTAYCLAIRTLINNAEDEDRAPRALEAVRAYGDRSDRGNTVS